jgi:hypothetical protein
LSFSLQCVAAGLNKCDRKFYTQFMNIDIKPLKNIVISASETELLPRFNDAMRLWDYATAQLILSENA